jgi:hypothetical protein
MRAYLIDPFTKTVTEVEHNGDYREIYKLIDAETFTTVLLNSRRDTVYLDDEGLFKPLDQQEFFMLRSYPNPLAGKGLVLGTNYAGDSVDPQASLEEVTNAVVWVDHELVKRKSEAGAFDTRITNWDTGDTTRVPFRPYTEE